MVMWVCRGRAVCHGDVGCAGVGQCVMVMWVCRGRAVGHGDGCAGAEEQIVNEQAVVMEMCGVGVQGRKSRL